MQDREREECRSMKLKDTPAYQRLVNEILRLLTQFHQDQCNIKLTQWAFSALVTEINRCLENAGEQEITMQKADVEQSAS
jgi:hypothetical protein